jgi:transposase
MDAIRSCCAGLDIHQATVVACILKGPLDRKPEKQIREFSTVLSGLLDLSDWLEQEGCSDVAMESTGVFWKPVYNVLCDTCILTVANAAHVKNIKGRKTDIKDAEWLAQLHRCDLIRSSFVPPKEIQNLRDLTRYRKKLKGNEASERNRILKNLEAANIKISTFITDVFGKSGRLMLHALVNGEIIEPEQIADLAKGRLRAKIPELVTALNGRVTQHHRQMIQRSLQHVEFLEQAISELEADMEQLFTVHSQQLQLLQTIPGVGFQTAKVLIAELGTDMSVFPFDAHISLWAGLSPGNNQSAGKKKSTRTTQGNAALKSGLMEAAWAAGRTRTYLGSKFWSITGRRGKNKAAVAVAHKILVITYHILKTGQPYKELGDDYLSKRKSVTQEEIMIKRLTRLGYSINKVQEEPTVI